MSDDDRRMGFGPGNGPGERPGDGTGGPGRPEGPGGPGGSGGGSGGAGGFGGSGGFGGLPGFGAGGPGGFDPSMFDPSRLGAVFGQLQRIFSSQADGPVDWDLARQSAREAVAGDDPTPSWGERSAVEQAGRLAEVWLDAVTTLPGTGAAAEAWSRAQWVEASLPTWRSLVTPVAEKMTRSMGSALEGGTGDLPPGLPPEMAGLLANAGPMMQRLGGGMLGMQLGQALGRLAGEAVSATDVGLPLHPGGMALVPVNIRAAAEGLGVSLDDVRLFLALREAAHARLFAHVPWLAPRLLGAVEEYAAGIDVDPGRIQEMLSGIDPSDPAALQEALSSGVLAPAESDAQLAAKARLENLLALVEGWVDTVVAEAAQGRLGPVAALRESVRRRRAAGGPAEQTFATLVGLELRPRRMREAAAWWVARGEADGDTRDDVWQHPDLLPDLDGTGDAASAEAPAVGTEGTGSGPEAAGDDMDAELRRLLEDAERQGGTDDEPDGEQRD
ncbi:zinc-dependent metalloprotease [Aquipuribacter sp. SD81]|uniref:zinc-dependent metalloprotease n=1 Tax=Aquipuribacter sp. SD81 TaxID=3127703 RepID=UPI00301A0D4E